ncbi:MAG: FtsX-like permease family protein, partial [Alcanivoracaceae bacterium]|nr:FtsX-like permease family protein [Alcanivoracaceae bacterium]
MFNTLWKKIWRDLWLYKSRSLSVILSISISTFALAVIMNSYAILSTEMKASYLKANPAAISYRLNSFNSDLIAEVQGHADVDKVEARRVISGQIRKNNGSWMPLILYVLRDYNDIRLDILESDKGDWPPQLGDIIIERQALSVLMATVGENIEISMPSGLSTEFNITGTAHDIVLAQAEWENVVYGYINEESLQQMGGELFFNQLTISLKAYDLDYEGILPLAKKINDWIEEKSHAVSGYSVAKPGEHPHANITSGMFMIQKVFAVLCCLFSAVLVFNLVSAILSRQLPQIGVMKAMGASARQIGKIYYSSVLFLGILGMTISLPLGYIVAKIYANALAKMMNFDIHDYSIPLWVLLTQVSIGIVIPLLTASLPIRRASKLSIRETFIEYGLQQQNYYPSAYEKWLLKFSFFSQPVKMALRNMLRTKFRFILTTIVLTFSGAFFMSSFNVSHSMKTVVVKERESKNWDIRLKFNQVIKQNAVDKMLASIEGIKSTERFNTSHADILDDFGKPVLKIAITQLKAESNMLDHQIIKGQWFPKTVHDSHDSGIFKDIAISQMVVARLPHLKIGMPLKLAVNGYVYSYNISAINQVLGLPAAYINNAEFFTSRNQSELANGYFITTTKHDRKTLAKIKNNIIDVAAEHDLSLSSISTSWQGLRVIEDHFDIIFSLMMLLTVIIIVIASNGIILTMIT